MKNTEKLTFTISTNPAIVERIVNESLTEEEMDQIKDQIKNEIRKQYEIPQHLDLVIIDCVDETGLSESGFID